MTWSWMVCEVLNLYIFMILSKQQYELINSVDCLRSFRRQALELVLIDDPIVLHCFSVNHDVNGGFIPLWGIVYNLNADRSTLLDIYWRIWPEFREMDRTVIDPNWDGLSLCDAIEVRCRKMQMEKCRYAVQSHVKQVMLKYSSIVPSYMIMDDEGVSADDFYIEPSVAQWKEGAYPIPGGDAFRFWYENRMSEYFTISCRANRMKLKSGVNSIDDGASFFWIFAEDEIELVGRDEFIVHKSIEDNIDDVSCRWDNIEMLRVHMNESDIIIDSPWKDTIRMIGGV